MSERGWNWLAWHNHVVGCRPGMNDAWHGQQVSKIITTASLLRSGLMIQGGAEATDCENVPHLQDDRWYGYSAVLNILRANLLQTRTAHSICSPVAYHEPRHTAHSTT